jgi:lipid-A-disaccharide synthase
MARDRQHALGEPPGDATSEATGDAPSLFVSTGSTSSDKLLQPVLAELRRRGRLGAVAGAGGAVLGDLGVQLFMDTTRTASVGTVAGIQSFLRHAGSCLSLLRQVERHFRRQRPALAILVDNSGINLPLLRRAHRHGIPSLYFVPPELWSVWPWETRAVVETPTILAPIFRTEADALARRGGRVRWVGHPLVDLLRDVPRPAPMPGDRPTIGLFPGSRRHELRHMLPVLRGAAARLHRAEPGARFVLSSANEAVAGQIRADLPAWTAPVEVVQGRSYEVLSHCNLLLGCSGTVTLEAALLGVPLVAMYRTNALDRLLAYYKLYRDGYPFLALPNALLGRRVVPELISADVNAERVAAEGMTLLRHDGRRREVLDGLAEVQDRLGPPGAIRRVADLAEELLDRRPGHRPAVTLTATARASARRLGAVRRRPVVAAAAKRAEVSETVRDPACDDGPLDAPRI